MSQYQFITTNNKLNKKVKVLIGWDRPLKYHFLVVECGHDYLYSNLDDDHSNKDLDYFYTKLDKLKIKAPRCLYQKLVDDQKNNRGNYSENYGEI